METDGGCGAPRWRRRRGAFRFFPAGLPGREGLRFWGAGRVGPSVNEIPFASPQPLRPRATKPHHRQQTRRQGVSRSVRCWCPLDRRANRDPSALGGLEPRATESKELCRLLARLA